MLLDGPCPYGIVKVYYDLCPDKVELRRRLQFPALKNLLIFMRAKQIQGMSSNHRFFKEQTTRLIPDRINLRLPDNLQVEGITPDSRRKVSILYIR